MIFPKYTFLLIIHLLSHLYLNIEYWSIFASTSL